MPELDEAQLDAILERIRQQPGQLSASDFQGERKAILAALRELRLRGKIDGLFEDNFTEAEDQHGKLLDDAKELVLR
ncbi:hypothetical protein [Pseudomonas mangiferae]|uniref:Uncharacterized protein n=1 Tax=Pseudomonas mangiferae TaxID=2593654 RepID=A0A553GZB4_9PSED|nr:hypothetical protein [Pseudomonas mangiferae]TRX74834.1 hypothetical protein FM069_09895 [Pseudomonas mangiferae]